MSRTDSHNSRTSLIFNEILAHLDIAWPVCLSFLLRKSTDVISVIAVGHLGRHYLSAVGIASVTANVTGNSMIWGLAGAISTICSQAVGMKDFKTLSITLQKSIIILLTCLCLPVSTLWFFSEPILRLFGQDEHLAHDASLYLKYCLPSLWTLSCSACIQNWLHSQSKTRPVAVIILIVATLHPLWCYIFIYYLNIGYLGAAISISVTKMLELCLLTLYINFGSNVLIETQFSLNFSLSLEDWWSFLRLGLPNLLMMSEWWASEMIIFMSGLLPNPANEVSAMSIYQNILSVCFMIPQGFNVSGSTRVGNALGASHPHTASLASFVSPTLAFASSTLTAIFLGLMRSHIGFVFTNDREVLEYFQKTIPFLVFYVIADGTQCALTGVMKGMGKQRIGGPIVLFSYYVVGMPISVCTSFHWGLNMGIGGLCLGTMVGTWCHFLLYAVYVMNTNWEKESEYLILEKQLTDKVRPLPDTHLDLSTSNHSKDSDNDSIGEWWDEIDFLGGLGNRSDSDLQPSSHVVTIRDRMIVIYNQFARRFGWKEKLSEYEMVKSCTDTILDDVVL